MDGKVLSNQTKKQIQKMIVDLINVSFFLKPIVNGIVSAVINWLDAKGDKVIPDEVDFNLNVGIQETFAGNYELASDNFATAANKVADLPNMDEDAEQKLFKSGILTIISIAEYWIKKKKATE